MLRRRTTRGASRGERGSLALAMVVLMVCAATAGLLVARNVSTAHEVVESRHRVEALHAAEAGLAEVQARIAVGDTADLGRTGTAGGANWSTSVTANPDDTFEVISTGERSSWSRTVAATIAVNGAVIDVLDWHQRPGSG